MYNNYNYSQPGATVYSQAVQKQPLTPNPLSEEQIQFLRERSTQGQISLKPTDTDRFSDICTHHSRKGENWMVPVAPGVDECMVCHRQIDFNKQYTVEEAKQLVADFCNLQELIKFGLENVSDQAVAQLFSTISFNGKMGALYEMMVNNINTRNNQVNYAYAPVPGMNPWDIKNQMAAAAVPLNSGAGYAYNTYQQPQYAPMNHMGQPMDMSAAYGYPQQPYAPAAMQAPGMNQPYTPGVNGGGSPFMMQQPTYPGGYMGTMPQMEQTANPFQGQQPQFNQQFQGQSPVMQQPQVNVQQPTAPTTDGQPASTTEQAAAVGQYTV